MACPRYFIINYTLKIYLLPHHLITFSGCLNGGGQIRPEKKEDMMKIANQLLVRLLYSKLFLLVGTLLERRYYFFIKENSGTGRDGI